MADGSSPSNNPPARSVPFKAGVKSPIVESVLHCIAMRLWLAKIQPSYNNAVYLHTYLCRYSNVSQRRAVPTSSVDI